MFETGLFFFLREKLWNDNNYNTLNIIMNDSDDEEESSEEDDNRSICYLKGDVTKPIDNSGNPSIIVHCVGKTLYFMSIHIIPIPYAF